VETQLEAKSYALEVFINIEKAFDSTLNKFIKETMIKREIPETLID